MTVPSCVVAGSAELAAAEHVCGLPAVPAQFPAVLLPEPVAAVAAAAAVSPVHHRAAQAARAAAPATAARAREHTQQVPQVSAGLRLVDLSGIGGTPC